MAAQPSTVPSMYAVQEVCVEPSIAQVGIKERRGAANQSRTASQHRPANCCTAEAGALGERSKPVSRDAGREQAVAIIPEMRWEELSDEALIAQARADAGKGQAEQYLNELFRRHHVKVARWCLSVTGDRESAADLAQEICVKAYQNISYFKGQSKFSTWLYSITRNHCLNALRSRSNAPEMDSDEMVMETLPDMGSDSPLATVERKQQAEIARQLINETLDETEKAVFTLHFGEELPLDAITRMLKLENTSGAKAYLVSAKRKLDRAVRRWKARA